MIKPRDFAWAEDLAIQKLQKMGRVVDKAPTYHSSLNEETQNRLIRTISPTALYIRTLPDLISVLETSKIPVFLFEVKAWKRKNLAVEAFPFGISRVLAGYNINILYLAVKIDGEIRGEFVEKINLPKEIRIPERWNDDERKRFRIYLSGLFPESRITEVQWTGGGGDPYFLIPKIEVDNWSLIDEIDTIKQTHLP